MTRKSTPFAPFIAAGATVIFWASAFPAVKYCLDYYSPESIMLLRFIVASSVLMGYCLIKRVKPPEKRDIPLFALTGFIGLFLYMWAFNTGTNMVPSGISGFMIASAPVFTLILSIVLLKEKAGLFTWVGVLAGFLGIVIIASTQITDTEINSGVWLLLAAALCTSIFNILQKRLTKKYKAIQTTAYSIAFGTLFMCLFFPSLIREFPAAPIQANLIVVYLGVFPAALAYFLWGYALSKAEKTIQVTSFLYLSPFLSSLMAFLWLGEQIPAMAYLGGAVIIIGMVITNFKRRN